MWCQGNQKQKWLARSFFCPTL
uniref:Uncharacterized protein n=1 Tax=Arundo donax TaxID=35708 RepID=A0A0A8ZWP4_ARUDO